MTTRTDAGPPPADPVNSGRRRRPLAAGLAVGLLIAGTAASAPVANAADVYFCADGTQPYLPVAEAEAVPAGTAVTGLSVTSGTTPEQFTGSYIGYIDDALGKGKDLLLYRLSSPVIDGTNGLKPAGIWAGMSGSPVYDSNGKLIGAVAYSLNYDNLPIAGVTPAEYMKSIGTSPVSSVAKVQVNSGNLKASPAGAKLAGTKLNGAALHQLPTVNVAGGAGAKSNAFTNRTLARTPRTAASADFLRSGTFLAAPNAADVEAPLVAGGNVVASYSTGDLVLGAIGTVTAVCGNTVWAFGHPMAFTGRTSLLLANASAAMIVPDGTGVVGSYKQVTAIGKPVGMITEDRYTGIKGTVGAVNSLPLTVTVQDAAGKRVAAYAAQVSDQEVTATATAYLTGQAAYEHLDQYASGTGKLNWTIKYRRANGSTGSLSNAKYVADRYYFPDEAATPAADDVWSLYDQSFEDITITGVDVTLRLTSADSIDYGLNRLQKQTSGTWAALSGQKLKAGSKYQVRAVYTKYRNNRPAGTVTGTPFTISLPSTAKTKGSLVASVTGAAAQEDSCTITGEGLIICSEWADPAATARNFDELVAALDKLPAGHGMKGKLSYRLKKGSASKTYSWTGPGVMFGTASSSFTVAAK